VLVEDLQGCSAKLAVEFADARTTPDGVLLETVAGLEAAQRMLDSARLAALAELDARGVPLARSGLNSRSWYAHEYQLPRPFAAAMVRTGVVLRNDLPVVAEALRAGRITVHHARFLVSLMNGRVDQIVIEFQQELLDLIPGARFERWTADVRNLIAAVDQDGPEPGADTNRLSMSDGLSGELKLDATLVGEHAAIARAALLAELERRYRFHRQLQNQDPAHHIPPRAQLLAEALTEVIRRGIAAGPNSKAPVTDATIIIQASEPLAPAGQGTTDNGDIAPDGNSCDCGPGDEDTDPGRARTTSRWLPDIWDPNGRPTATTPDGVRLQDGTTRRLLCDAAITAVIIDTLGVPLDMGRTDRLFTPEQRRAISVRDGGCIHPGCDQPASWTQIHHVDEYHDDNGPTDLPNGAMLCPPHHDLMHHDGWTITPDPDTADQGFIITTPSGRPLRSQQHGRPRAEPGRFG